MFNKAKKAQIKAREQRDLDERFKNVHGRIDYVGNLVVSLERDAAILTARAESVLPYVDACVDQALTAHEMAFHAPKKSPRKDKKGGKK